MTDPLTPRKVLVSPVVMEQMATRTDDGYRINVDWGEPDDDGFYDPVLTIDYADSLAARADTAALEHRAYRIVERAANMGGCSQTHHEHLLRDARKVLATLDAARADTAALVKAAFLAGVRRGASDGMEAYPEVADDYLLAALEATDD